MSVQALSMDDAKGKLARLEELMPDGHDLICEFGHYLATRLNPQLVPVGFVMVCELALYDLLMGVNGFTGKPLQNKLTGYPPSIYTLLRMEIPRIAEVIFPSEFAREVKNYINEFNATMQAER